MQRFGEVIFGQNFKQWFDFVAASIHGLNGSLEGRFGVLRLQKGAYAPTIRIAFIIRVIPRMLIARLKL